MEADIKVPTPPLATPESVRPDFNQDLNIPDFSNYTLPTLPTLPTTPVQAPQVPPSYEEVISAYNDRLVMPEVPQVPVQTTAPLIPIEEAVAQRVVDPNIKVSYKNRGATAPAITPPAITPPAVTPPAPVQKTCSSCF